MMSAFGSSIAHLVSLKSIELYGKLYDLAKCCFREFREFVSTQKNPHKILY